MNDAREPRNVLDRLIYFCLNNRLVVLLLVLMAIFWGILVAPFDWNLLDLPRDPVPVDAIPDLGENQQIIFTRWPGRSPQDIEDQISYPLTASLLGIPGIKTVRSFSMFGFSSIYLIFEEDRDFYWTRARIVEKLNSLPAGTLPEGITPMLGPDATALGQVYWYTLEGRDADGNPTGGWDLQELRTIQDYYVRYGLMSARGISEIASVGGFVQEYQVDVDPNALQAYNLSLDDVFHAVQMSNLDVGARTIEINSVEYVIRGIGFVKNLADLENSVIKTHNNVPVLIRNVARVSMGPALRRGALDKGGAEVVGGVAVVRYGENPMAAIAAIKEKIAEIAPGLPHKTLADGTQSQVTIVPFYDRSGLIKETLGTLNSALSEQMLVTIIVVLLMVMHLRSAMLISGLLPLAVLITFIGMKQFGVDANIVALSGIAIAIGTMVDMGIVITENILKHLDRAAPEDSLMEVVFQASREVGSAVITAVATTVISFLPVFTMEGAEGKLFKPLAYTKTFALIASVIVAITIIPPLAQLFFKKTEKRSWLLLIAGLASVLILPWWGAGLLILAGLLDTFPERLPESWRGRIPVLTNSLLVLTVGILLTEQWLPLGPGSGFAVNLIFVALLIGGLLGLFFLFQRYYPQMLGWTLANRPFFMSLVAAVILLGLLIWLGFSTFFGWLPQPVKTFKPVSAVAHTFPGLGKEFMPPLDEGSFLYMPTTMPHASIGEVLDILQKQDIS
ncbi:MAG: efflux RND transporter permease subunit, partial [Calditrichaeota bacterium]|nr:efflux RND transporter permease subunit [Calditrichota bacterium]